MSERISKTLQEAQAKQAEARQFLQAITGPFVKDLLETVGDKKKVEDIIKDVTNIAGAVAALAVQDRKVEALEKTTLGIFKQKSHPDNHDTRRDMLSFSRDASQVFEQAAENILNK